MTRDEVRAAFPNAVAFADLFRDMGATLKFAEQDGRSIGKPHPGKFSNWFAMTTYTRKGRA